MGAGGSVVCARLHERSALAPAIVLYAFSASVLQQGIRCNGSFARDVRTSSDAQHMHIACTAAGVHGCREHHAGGVCGSGWQKCAKMHVEHCGNS